MALLKSQISVNSTDHFIMKMTQRQLVSRTEETEETEETETHVYIHTTIFKDTQHEELIKVVKHGANKRVHRSQKIVLESQQSSETLFNWRRVNL